ncbi:hypothetical protein [Chitinophaga pinensis]|uniref:Tetratricopeptide repeat protein n=1 Tax=Chitinophaga pinensis TaxID=79329 RepID=A0A5C6LUW0_9BACT|nr:hypothetical protein [Chitinophaga pinensis]TWW00494.1 hypothetical protein FEF09_10620 [Chitinophaga pinensis]
MSCLKKSVVICTLLSLFSFVAAFAGDYEKAWDALNKNDKTRAVAYFRNALKSDPAKRTMPWRH